MIHIYCGLTACALAIVVLCCGALIAVQLETKTIHSTAPKDFAIKNQGLAFQRATTRSKDILLLYGSSELIDPIANRASEFFATARSGFQVCPIGKGGTTSLIFLEKLGALGSDLRGRKVAISLSASPFFRPAVNPSNYAGNFSLPAASGLLFGDALDFELKSAIARRMLEFPNTLERSALLQLAANCFASGRLADRIILAAIWPLGKLQNIIFDLQDHFQAVLYIQGREKEIKMPKAWPGRAQAVAKESGEPGAERDAVFRERLMTSAEWRDLELLFRTVTEIGVRPLILSMPIDRSFYDAISISRSVGRLYYSKMRELAARYGVQLVQFEDHDADPAFLIAHREHPTPEGWTYYDRALNDFFHNSESGP